MGLTAAKLRRAAQRELKRRAQSMVATALATITAEGLSGPHARQLAMIRDAALYMVVLCSRRAGKTYGLACLALLTELARPRQNILYIGLSKPHARKFLWNEVWCPLLDRLDPHRQWHKRLDDEMTTTFANGSIMYVSGTDDVRHIESFLGNRLNLAIVDEAQSQSDSVLVPLTTRILPNALLDDMDNPGKLVMAGTIPEVNAGRFMEVWNNPGAWSKHNWNRFENPHLTNQEAALAAYLAANPGLSEDSPEVQREWFGRFKFDPTATAYRFMRAVNVYVPTPAQWLRAVLDGDDRDLGKLNEDERGRLRVLLENGRAMAAQPWKGIRLFGIGIDIGGGDRMAVTVNGWGSHHDVQHVFEWASKRNSNLSWNDLGLVLAMIAPHYASSYWYYDTTSANELDTFSRLYGVPVVKAAVKADLEGQVRLFNALLTSGKYKAMLGSQLIEDFEKARWDPDALKRGQRKWASSWHPDPSEAGRYSLRDYFDGWDKPDQRSEAEKINEAWTAPQEVNDHVPDDVHMDGDLESLMR